jgi:hypothetical protein
MKTYLIVTGGLFGLIGITHLVRLFVEGESILANGAEFIATNLTLFVLGTGLAAWATLLWRRQRRERP